MSGNFESVGLRFDSEEDLDNVIRSMREAHTDRFDVPAGFYLRWRCSSGAELWLQCDTRGEWSGLNPWFGAGSTTRVRVTAVRCPDGFPPLERRVEAWMLEQGSDPGEQGLYPFEFDAVDGARYDTLRLPIEARVRLAAFPSDVECFTDEMSFLESQPGTLKLSAESLIPSGLFAGEERERRFAQAEISGVVRHSAMKANDLGGRYCWAAVSTYGMTLDVVLNGDEFPSPLPPGAVLRGTFWLSGRLELS